VTNDPDFTGTLAASEATCSLPLFLPGAEFVLEQTLNADGDKR